MFRSSPSAIALWQLCPARAVAKYVWGYEDPETPAMMEGTRLHRLVQRYLYAGDVPASSELAARKIIEVLPVPAGSINAADIERVVLLPEHHGYLDWMRGSAKHGDLKFTKSVRHQQAKDPTTDPQRIIYAVDAFANDPALTTLKQYWSISQFDGQKALTLEHRWTKDSAKQAYKTIIRPVHTAMAAAIKTRLHWQDAEKNVGSCDTYPPNGCVMKQHGCRRSLKARLIAISPKGPK